MKKTLALLSILIVGAGLFMAPIAAFSEADDALLLSAVVRVREQTALKAPASGELAPFTAREGDVVASGDTLFQVEARRVYADMDGTVADVYVAPGDIADAAVARYGAVLKLDFARRYEIVASTRTGYNTAVNRDLRVGMPVYLRAANERHFANGTITALNGAGFTVQVLDGDLIFTDDVKIYRQADYNNRSLLARANLSIVDPYGVSVSGTVTEVGVQPGQSVRAGDFLLAYVPDALEPDRRGKQNATAVVATEALLLTEVQVSQGASVQKGQTLALCCPVGAYELVAQAAEADVGRLNVGDTLTARFEELALPDAQAVVTAISPLGAEGEESKFTVYLSCELPDGVWPGMHVTAER